MIYDRMFNNTMAIWTAFGGTIEPSLDLGWIGLNSYQLGFEGYLGRDYFNVYDNGNACIVISSGSKNYQTISYYDKTEKGWKNISFPAGQYYNSIIAAQNGVFMCADIYQPRGNIYTSKNGKDWIPTYQSSYGNQITCGATNGLGGVSSRWYVYTPVFIKNDITMSGSWTMVGTYYADDMLCYTHMTYHKDRYVGIASDSINDGTHKGGLLTSVNNGLTWQRQIQYPKDNDSTGAYWDDVRSVHGKLFVQTSSKSLVVGTSEPQYYYLGLMDDSASSYKTVLKLQLGTSESQLIPMLSTMIYVDSLGMYMLFAKDILYYSYDGQEWKSQPQKNFGNAKSSAIYIPGDGFYVGCGLGQVYYAAYP